MENQPTFQVEKMIDKDEILNKRLGLGAGIGGLTGFFFFGPVGGIAGAAIGGALARVAPKRERIEMSPEGKMAFKTMMATEKTPEELREMAVVLDGQGHTLEAEMLRGRAALRELPAEVREQRKEIYRRAMASDDVEEIREFAGVFDAAQAFSSAQSLRQHADAVDAAHAAGKSCKPMEDTKQINLFGAKLAKAVISFGPDSNEAKSAARNFIRARGIQPTDEEIARTLATAAAELDAAIEASASSSAGAAASTGTSSASTGTPAGTSASTTAQAPTQASTQAPNGDDTDEDEDTP